jgi:hypothetical protein
MAMTETKNKTISIERHLIPGENILARAGGFYATNKRIIKYRKGFFGEELDDFAYSHISSISYISGSRPMVINTGIVLAILGVIGIVVNIFTEVRLVTPLCIVDACVGTVLIVYGIFSRVTDVQFRASGLTESAGAKLRMKNVRSEDATRFISLVREYLK